MDDSLSLHKARVSKLEPVADKIFLLELAAPELARDFRPGQFMGLAVPGDPSQIVRVPLSSSGTDVARGLVQTVFAVVGDGTRRLSELPLGAAIEVLGPGGHGWRELAPAGRALLVAGGVGVTPIMALARALGDAGASFDVVVGSRTKAMLWGEDELAQAGADKVIACTDDGSYGHAGFTTEPTSELLSICDYARVYTCGPQPMMAGVARVAQKCGIPCEVSFERMMTCGFGVCHTCNVAMAAGGYSACCTDGPVYDSQEVAW